MSKIFELTGQQKALIADYRMKWYLIAISTQPVDKAKAFSAIKAVYKKISNAEIPDIYYFESPLSVANLSFISHIYPVANLSNQRKLNNIIRKVKHQLIKRGLFRNSFHRHIIYPLIEIVGQQFDIELWKVLHKQLTFLSPLTLIHLSLRDSEKSSLIWKSGKPNQQREIEQLWFYLATGLVSPDAECSICGLLDFCTSELGCFIEEDLWNTLRAYVSECGWTFFFQDFCFTCQRPQKVLLDEQNRPHAENESAIEFLDGFSVFAKNGTLAFDCGQFNNLFVPDGM
ncbi:hypothetical protein [Nostoc sp. 'Peltigera membranacea cyanobiont' N6]|uniref:hypothetical protein n=1 Tax=Nostoc sp. 'Peltigera membranacea cyanobiont' N6 TaxID=1261031 RepID=UPI000CF31F89|nr:hypothetical protein [Nostoc sp. 'Peltigera membranacea cyanobiont' N6]AVH64689.1 hypothetical protein NPM_3063 [Nostoc sp. 'Peltigera membranacea cyanobiont' N6]